MTTTADVLVVGGGIAGVSVAAELASDHRVVLVEAEQVLAHHTTGRSAAILIEGYGHPAVRALTSESRALLLDPPGPAPESPLCHPRQMVQVAREDQLDELARLLAQEPSFEAIDGAGLRALVPVLASSVVAGAIETTSLDLDVGAIHQWYLRRARDSGAQVFTRARLAALTRMGGGWEAVAGPHTIHAATVVNAAGAWGDVVSAMAGVAPAGLTPCRRTAFTVKTTNLGSADWPLVVDVSEQFYFRPEGASQLLCSPADETPEDPRDTRHEELDVAIAIERINAATTLNISHVLTAWAGQRTFSPDRAPVIGFDTTQPGFFWLVGQGGTGIQTAPGAARLAAGIIRGTAQPGPLGPRNPTEI